MTSKLTTIEDIAKAISAEISHFENLLNTSKFQADDTETKLFKVMVLRRIFELKGVPYSVEEVKDLRVQLAKLANERAEFSARIAALKTYLRDLDLNSNSEERKALIDLRQEVSKIASG